MARAERSLKVTFLGDSRDLERAFRKSGKSADTFGRKLSRGAGKGMLFLGGGVATAAIAGLAGVSVGLVKAGKAASEAEASNARLRAQLKAMGKDNTAVRGQIEQTVQSLSKLGAFDDEDLQDAFTTLVRSSGNVAKSQKDLALVADVARGAQLDLATAAKLVNRVNAGNVGSLKRYGIALEDGATKEQAIAALRAKFAGQAEAYANTAAGAQEAFAIATENALEQVGVALTPLIVEFSKFARDVLPRVAAAVSVYLGQAITWLKANWPQIKAILQGVWEGLRFAFENIVKPAVKGIIVAVGAMVSFIRANMPAIRATAQAVFGWLETNVVPTMRTIGRVVATVVEGMTYVWREHGNSIKAVVGPAFNTIKTIIGSALTVIRSTVEMVLALLRGDFDAAAQAFRKSFEAAFRGIVAILKLYPEILFNIAKVIGTRLVDGIINGLSGLYSRVKAKLESDLRNVIDKLNPFSPVQHGGEIIAKRLTDGMIVGLQKNRARVAKGLSATVRQAVYDARGNLGSLTGGLAGMLGQLAGTSSPEARRLQEIRAQQTREANDRRESEIKGAIESAKADEAAARAAFAAADTDEKRAEAQDAINKALAERAQAEQDLGDFLLEQEAARLEESIANNQRAYEQNIADLTARFNDGKISAQEFRDELARLVGGNTGSELGYAFASEFGAQLEAVAGQIAALVGFAPGAGGPGVTSPAGAQFEEDMKKWRDRKKQLEDALADARADARKEDSPGKKNVTKAEQERIDAAKERLDKHVANKPKKLAMGGVLRRAVLAGEAGPEAVLPLSGGRAQRMLASALEGADRINGRGGGTTVVNVTVNGNEFSAREFARKLKPELDRVVGFGTV